MLGELLEGKPHEQFLWGGAGNGRSISAPRQSLTRQTDVRSLKRTVHLHHITAKSEDMMEKELLMAVAAYNLVRAIMCLAAQQHGLSARQLSFAHVLNVVRVACLAQAGRCPQPARASSRIPTSSGLRRAMHPAAPRPAPLLSPRRLAQASQIPFLHDGEK